MAKKSIVVAASFGLATSLFLMFSGDESAYQVARTQPMKLAAMEGLHKGEQNAGLVAMGVLDPSKKPGDGKDTFLFELKVPYALGIMATRKFDSFTPGIEDLVYGNEAQNIESVASKMTKGSLAVSALASYNAAKKSGDKAAMEQAEQTLAQNMKFLGYGYLKSPESAVPPVGITFYSFHLMVALGTYFLALFLVVTYLTMANDIENFKKLLWACVFSIPLGLVAIEAGWIVAEVGRQPWVVQDLMTVGVGATNLADTNIKISFWLFAVLFTVLLIAEIKIMLKQIKIGFENHA